jgi:hypothetical protein
MPGDENMMAKLDMAKLYSYLLQALGGEDGFDPTNSSAQKSMCSLLREFNGLLNTAYELNTNDMPNTKISYVQVPQIESDCSFLNSKEWVARLTFRSLKKMGRQPFGHARHASLTCINVVRSFGGM